MTEVDPKVKKEDVNGENLSDIEIAELANKELKKKADEVATLKKELAKAKLYATAEEEVVERPSKEDCIKRLSENHITNYDYAETVCHLVDIEKEEGRVNPLGKNGEQVYEFFKDVLEECDGDKSRFPSIYQARLGADDAKTAMAYKNRR